MEPPDVGNFGVGSWIERRARMAPEAPALVSGGRTLTYSDVAARVRRLANGFRAMGVGHGDRVAWLGQNDPAFIECLFAAGLLGAVLAPVNHRLAPAERTAVLEDTDPIVVVEHHVMPPTVMSPSVRARVAVGGPREGAIDYGSLVASSPDDAIDAPVGLDDLLLLPHTSGTTGSPKGVMLTHGNVTWNVINFLSCADFRHDDVTIAIAPFFRVGGTGVNVLPVLFMGGTVVVPEDLEPDRILSLIEAHRVTVGFGNPDLLEALVRSEHWPDADLSSVRFVITGGAPVPERLIRVYLERGVTLLQGYGLSEAGPLALLLDAPSALGRVGSAGRPPLLVDVRIAGSDGRAVAPGETGELLVRGPNVMAGYWNRPADTQDVLIEGGWLRTGDAARADGEGFVWIVDRVSAGFASAGGMVYPGDVERVLMSHPGVADAGVVGVPAAGVAAGAGARAAAGAGASAMGVAFVVSAPDSPPTEEELLAFARERLPPHAVPAAIRYVDELPRNSVGKLRREELRARWTEAAGEPA